ncbi:hypothetical protein [Parapedobacter defluvii]|uniref:argonaute/piwi family protein n=1 Tax=Parapedobacter defluvii TaxID=2045106 RepID=UPI00333E2055
MNELPSYSLIAEPKLLFSDRDLSAVSGHPLDGLLNFGPYSDEITGNDLQSSIRIAAIYPERQYSVLKSLVNELNSSHQPLERKSYLRTFTGFKNIFKKDIYLLDESKCVSLPEQNFGVAGNSHTVLSELLVKAIRYINRWALEFDVLYIYLPDAWKNAFECKEENFDLHDFLKAVTASYSIPTQIIREGSATNYRCRCSVAWRLSIATFVKAGGIPWRLNSLDKDTAVIGLSYSQKQNLITNKQEFLTCCSQVFDSDGTGLEFIAYEADEYQIYGDNPFLSRFEMRRVMQRSAQLYASRHPHTKLRKIIVHKTTPFTNDEMEGCFDAFPNLQVELLQIKQNTPWKAIKIEAKKRVSGYPVNRGVFLQLGHNEALVWTQGVTKLDGKDFFKEGKGIPSPLHVHQFAGSGNWFEHCSIIMALTKMNWNHDSLYDRLPVTLSYASTLASTLKSLPKLSKRPYQFKYFM